MENKFSKNLQELRKSKKLSQQAIANIIGTTQSHINKLEHAYIEANFSTLINLAKFFNVTTDQLLGVEKPMVEKTAPELTPEQLQIVELIKKLPKEDLQKVYGYLLGLIDARS